MNRLVDKTPATNKSHSAANTSSEKGGGEHTFQFTDNRPEAIVQKRLQEIAGNSAQASHAAQFQAIAAGTDAERRKRVKPPLQMKKYAAPHADVLQMTFDEKSARAAIMGATKPMHHMAGSAEGSKGAYSLETDSKDRDVQHLVLKGIGGSSSAVMASEIFNMVDLPAPGSLMLPIDEGLINKLKVLVADAPRIFGQQVSIEVQQHTSIASLPPGPSSSGKETTAAILAGDVLTGNHDRIYSKNEENFSRGFAIDNTVREDTIEAKAMMATAEEMIQGESKRRNEMTKLLQYPLPGSDGEFQLLKNRRAFLSQLRGIAAKAAAIRKHIEATNKQQDANAAQRILRLKEMDSKEEPIPGEPLELVIAQTILQYPNQKYTRKGMITSNIESNTKAIGKDRYGALGERLLKIVEWNTGGLVETALGVIDKRMEVITAEFEKKRKKWDEDKAVAVDAAGKAWDKKKFYSKLFSNKTDHVKKELASWDKLNPEPRMPG